jgi:hypothetical protein
MPGALTHQKGSRASWMRDKDFSVNFDDFLGAVNCSKIFIFSSNNIFVVLSTNCFLWILYLLLTSLMATAVTDRIRLEVVTEPSRRFGRRSAPRMIRLVPNKDRGCTSIRSRTLRPSRGKSAGLPLDHSGIRYADQNKSKFEDSRSIDIEFHSTESEHSLAVPALTHTVSHLILWLGRLW